MTVEDTIFLVLVSIKEYKPNSAECPGESPSKKKIVMGHLNEKRHTSLIIIFLICLKYKLKLTNLNRQNKCNMVQNCYPVGHKYLSVYESQEGRNVCLSHNINCSSKRRFAGSLTSRILSSKML